MKERIGFKQGLEYLMEVLCYAYYCKSDNLISDIGFDELEKIYTTLFDVKSCPKRGQELESSYSYGTKFIYDEIKCRQKIDNNVEQAEEDGFKDFNDNMLEKGEQQC